jgi:D-tyrosyl-tRNA(Tyr) deacylase
MKIVLQRVRSASVAVAEKSIAEIGYGLLALVGVVPGDSSREVDWLVKKTAGLRIFPEGDKNMNRSVVDVGGEVLVVSQFTLAAETAKGMRPGFSNAAEPALAESLYDEFALKLDDLVPTQTGQFGADMQVALINDGPVTVLLER